MWAAPIITTVDAGGDVGQYTSLELNGANPVITYYDVTNGDLKLAICANATCTASSLITLDTGVILPSGLYTSLELDVTPAGRPIVSYFDLNGGGSLKTATCVDAPCTTVTTTVVDNPAGLFPTVGQYNSLALVGSNPVISYYNSTSGLMVAACTDSACATPVTPTNVDNGTGTGDVGTYTSMVLNGGNPVISYYDSTANTVKIAACANTACTTATTVTVAAGGLYSALALDGGNPVIAYQNGTSLQVAVCTDPLCAAAPTILTPDTGSSFREISLDLTAGGCPVISYFDPGTNSLKVAAYNGASCTLLTVSSVDTGGVGEFTSIELNAAGFPVISYYDRTNGDLKVVVCDTATCAPSPIYTSVPARTGSTIALTGATGSTQNANIAVTNTGAATSQLDVALISVSAGYTITGLPIVDQLVGAAAVNINVSCTVPTAAGTLVVETNEPGNPQYTYNLTCTVPAVVPTPTTAVPGSSGGSSGGGSSSSSVVVFDPAISKLGFLQPGQSGARGEQIEWMVTVINNGSTDGQNIVVSDTLNADLRIDRVNAPGGTVNTTGQTVTVTYATLSAGQGVQFSIFTTVLRGVEINNTACLTASNLTDQRCSTGRVVREMPATGEIPVWSTLLRVGVLVLLAGLSLIGILSYVRRHAKRSYQA